MQSTTTLFVSALLLFSSITKSNALSGGGNLAVCISDTTTGGGGGGSGIGGGRRCLDPVFDGIPRPSFRAPPKDVIGSGSSNISNNLANHHEELIEAPIPNWRYDNGLLRVVGAGGADADEDDLCLAPASPITTASSEPIDLVLRKCPTTDSDKTSSSSSSSIAVYERSVALERTRDMRFVTSEGRIVFLAPFGDGTSSRSFFCLTLFEPNGDVVETNRGSIEKVGLAPCQSTDEPDDADDEAPQSDSGYQVFDIYGPPSETFLMPLRQTWGYQDTVQIAYQFGLSRTKEEGTNDPLASSSSSPVDVDDSDAYIELSILSPLSFDGIVVRIIIDTIPLSSNVGGILSFVPSAYRMDGRMTARLKQGLARDDDADLVLEEVSFLVSRAEVGVGQGPAGHYVLFAILLGCFFVCFLLSTLAERFCSSRTRVEEDGNNDGKTVCLSVEEEEDEGFALEDGDPEETASSSSSSSSSSCFSSGHQEMDAPENEGDEENQTSATASTIEASPCE